MKQKYPQIVNADFQVMQAFLTWKNEQTILPFFPIKHNQNNPSKENSNLPRRLDSAVILIGFSKLLFGRKQKRHKVIERICMLIFKATG